MKIENIIEDIKKDIKELSNKVADQLNKENPDLNFSISLPDIDELTTIKSMLLTIEEEHTRYYLSVHIHTHNGNRVFENAPTAIGDGQAGSNVSRHPLQKRFVDILREIIKRNKNKVKSINRAGDLFDDLHPYSNTG